MYNNNNNTTKSQKGLSYYLSLPSYYLDKIFRTIFYYIGYATATAPILFIVIAVIFTAGIGVGIKNIQLITDPQGLWVPPDSDTVKQKNYFDDQFSPFFRIEQMIIFPKNPLITNAINPDMIEELFQIQREIDSIQVYDGNCSTAPITINDLCYKPIPSKGCMIQTPLQFYQMNYNTYKTQEYYNISITSHVYFCTQRTSLSPNCLSDIGIPLYDKQMFGKVAYNATTFSSTAQALIVTILLNNDNVTAARALLWEKEFLKVAQKPRTFSTIYVSAERSVQDELADETSGDISTVLISYAVMFVYVAISLGQIHPIKSRIIMGLAGVIIVVMSIIISAGICCLAGVPATLIIMEVMPFLILAIGVDNMFIMANHLDQVVKRKGSKLTVAESIAETMATVGSSMTLASVSEFLAFMLGSLTKMPAVQAFCIFSGVAIIANFVLQVTCFSALLSLDLRRRLSNRLELEPTIVITNKYFTRDWISIAGGARFIMKKVIAPIVTFLPVSFFILFVFLGLCGASIYGSMFLSQGLDQITALPTGSYLGEYFLKQREYVDLGPPVYYVTKNLDYTSHAVQDQMSRMMNIVAETDYLDRGSILFFYTDFKKWVLSNECSHKNVSANHVPPEHYVEWLKEFLEQEECCKINFQVVPLCGFQFKQDVRFSADGKSIDAARLMTQTKTLVTQEDFINSMKSSYFTSTYLANPQKYSPTTSFGPLDTYPYSIYYIYFAQYLYLPEVSAMNIMIASGAVFLTTLILLGSPVASIYVLICICMILTNLLGVMAVWGIYVNALSVVNLVMSIGISVEFCVHITRAFMKARGTHKERVKKAMVEMGSSVLSGITFTKFIGVVVLAFSHSEIFRIYYFRMYLSIVVSGALHGLLFLPSLLLIAGPQQDPVAKLKGEEEEDEEEEQADVNIEGRTGFVNPHITDDDEETN